MCKPLAPKIFPHQVLGPIIIGTEHDILTKFLKMKSTTFVSSNIEDAFQFVVDCNKGLYKMDIIKQHSVEFVTLQL